ncbi:dihydrodipicolinate synthase family protein [Bradyrhizobium sp. CCBAU 11361]|uniref:dihydrodipicolinate synthase family protein n=1 Tax=Bradyrhizobium sp. CCBAU 11361 TaxID=1630812 RepID=UPI002304445E|nr:dihydrodipicolinate synthase family protein [Bradyrhizobium sp. CCBAU 11361]
MMVMGREIPEIWAAIHTPFDDSGAIDEAGIRRNVRHYIATGLAGVFCNGLIGEVWSLTLQERQRVVEVIADEAGGRLGISVVISGPSVEETIELGEHARRLGVSHAVLMVPTSGPRSPAQQFEYLHHICTRLEMPIVIFNARTAAGSPLDPAVFTQLCSLPNLKLLKTTGTTAENAALRQAARNGVLVSDPLEENFFVNMQGEGQSILYADPEPYLYQRGDFRPIANYVALLASGQTEEAARICASLAPQRAVFNKWIMDPLKRGHMPNAAVKHWCDLVGIAGGAVRAPVTPLSAAERRELEADLVACEAPGLLSAAERTSS